jgi:hypothetical protein
MERRFDLHEIRTFSNKGLEKRVFLREELAGESLADFAVCPSLRFEKIRFVDDDDRHGDCDFSGFIDSGQQ